MWEWINKKAPRETLGCKCVRESLSPEQRRQEHRREEGERESERERVRREGERTKEREKERQTEIVGRQGLRHQSVEQVLCAALWTQPQQTCPTLPAPGRWRKVRILTNFSKLWVSRLSSPLSFLFSTSYDSHNYLPAWGWLSIHHSENRLLFHYYILDSTAKSYRPEKLPRRKKDRKIPCREMLLKGNPWSLQEVWDSGCWIQV